MFAFPVGWCEDGHGVPCPYSHFEISVMAELDGTFISTSETSGLIADSRVELRLRYNLRVRFVL
jgi:hypothetical protein